VHEQRAEKKKHTRPLGHAVQLKEDLLIIILTIKACDQHLKTGISTIQIPDFAAAHIYACTWVLQLKEMSVKKIFSKF